MYATDLNHDDLLKVQQGRFCLNLCSSSFGQAVAAAEQVKTSAMSAAKQTVDSMKVKELKIIWEQKTNELEEAMSRLVLWYCSIFSFLLYVGAKHTT